MKTEPIIPFSLSFTAGVTVASCINAGYPYCTAALSGVFLLIGISIVVQRGEAFLLLGAVALAGFYSAESRSLSGTFPGDIQSATRGLTLGFREYMRTLTASIPFSDRRTPALIDALLCGDRSALPRGTVEAFRKSGASHLLALSGLHLGVLATGLGAVLEVLGRSRGAQYAKSAIIIAFCLLYLLACGAGPSLQRAFFFIAIRQILSHDRSRRLSPSGTLCLALTIQLTIDPLSIRSASFQLSYLAMAGITFIYPRLEAFYPGGNARPGPIRKVWNNMALSVSCQIATLPVVWIRFHSLPQCFILTNLISLPICEALVASGAALTAMSALGFHPKALITMTDFLSRLLLSVMETIASD